MNSFTWSKWEYTGSNYLQHIRMGSDKNTFELIQIVWLDAVTKEEKKSEWIVVRDLILLSHYDDEEKENYISSYGYSLDDEDVSDWLIAECILEEDCMNDSCIIGEFDNEDDAEKLVKSIVNENN